MRWHTAPERRQAGDTIVEVLIAAAVVGLTLGGAFVVSSQSTKNVRASQEHSEALQLLQGQVEQVRAAAATATFPAVNTPFCMANGSVSSQCALLSDGSDGGTCTDNFCYTVAVTRGPDLTSTTNTTPFTFEVSWDGLTNSTEHETLVYRVKTGS